MFELSIMTWSAVIAVALISGLSKSGFGGALSLASVPLLALFLSPLQAAAILLPLLVVCDTLGVYLYRRGVDQQLLIRLLAIALVGMSLGYLGAKLFPIWIWYFVVGLIAALFSFQNLIRHWRGRSVNDQERSPLWAAFAGFSSFATHTGAPPLHIYLLSKKLPQRDIVGLSFFFFFTLNVIKLPLYFEAKILSTESLSISLLALPATLVGFYLGAKIIKYVKPESFALPMNIIIFISGIVLTARGFLASLV